MDFIETIQSGRNHKINSIIGGKIRILSVFISRYALVGVAMEVTLAKIQKT